MKKKIELHLNIYTAKVSFGNITLNSQGTFQLFFPMVSLLGGLFSKSNLNCLPGRNTELHWKLQYIRLVWGRGMEGYGRKAGKPGAQIDLVEFHLAFLSPSPPLRLLLQNSLGFHLLKRHASARMSHPMESLWMYRIGVGLLQSKWTQVLSIKIMLLDCSKSTKRPP